MFEVSVKNVPVQFPFKPYKVQEDYMSKVMDCLQQGVNGVLESPTGTGKTLSLLCASLAWLQTKKAQSQASAQGLLLNNDSKNSFRRNLESDLQKLTGLTGDGETAVTWSETKIIYASRTHSQLAQAMKELKRTSYAHVKTAVLGSREQLCIHPDLAGEHNHMKVTLCQIKKKAKSCHYLNNLDNKKYDGNFFPGEVIDIEDLVKFGHKSQCCPYYLARERMSSSDLIFMPYNYLLNPITRHTQQISLDNAVIILDEAHNVERVCEECASVHFNSTEIALCIAEIRQVMNLVSEDVTKNNLEDTEKDFSLEDLAELMTSFLQFEAAVDEIQLDTYTEGPDRGKKHGKSFPASFIFTLLSKAKINIENLEKVNSDLSNIAQFLSTNSESPLSRKGGVLMRFSEFLKIVFSSCGENGDTKQSDLYYKVFIEPEVPRKNKPDSWSSTKTVTNPRAKVINFWCFSPAFAMRSLASKSVHCVILTSGTLSPLLATISELGIPVPVQLENPHIIEASQVSVNVISKGPTNEKLISTYANRENPRYLEDLGRMLNNFCRVVPDGILMFFPSYPLMEKTISNWQETGLWSKINDLKNIFVEPQRRDRLGDIMNDFNQVLETEGSQGAVFLAVLRGKVSEGMDFADTRCRAVIITGLPYPPFKDPKVVLKQEYINTLRKSNPKIYSGRDWYELEATRAVNQAVGRVIRHVSDFGAILLCDCRFESIKITNNLSAWLRPHIVKCSEFGQAYGRVSKFFKSMGVNPPLRPVQSGASFDYVDIKVRTKENEQQVEQKGSSHNSIHNFLEKVRVTQPKATPPPTPTGLLDILNSSHQQKKGVNIRKNIYEQASETSEAFVQPALKKRKLKIQPIKFDSACDKTNEAAASLVPQRSKDIIEYKQKVEMSLTTENLKIFKDTVKSYASSNEFSYEKTVVCLRKIFPDPSTKDLFIGFKRFIKKEHMSKFEELCFRLFGSASS